MKYLILTTTIPFQTNWLPADLGGYLKRSKKITFIINLQEMTVFNTAIQDWQPIEGGNFPLPIPMQQLA